VDHSEVSDDIAARADEARINASAPGVCADHWISRGRLANGRWKRELPPPRCQRGESPVTAWNSRDGMGLNTRRPRPISSGHGRSPPPGIRAGLGIGGL